MSSLKDFTEDIKPLKQSPSAPLWDLEIRKVLGGRRAHLVRKHGGPQAYIELLIAESVDADLARSTFNEALRNFVQEWQTAKPETEYYISGLLDLIIAYTPVVGAVKLLSHINRWGRFGKNVFIQGEKKLDLHLKALEALEKLLPISSQEEGLKGTVFSAYVNILKAHVSHPAYCGHALKRLIELEEFEPLSGEVVDAIRRDLGVLSDLIPPFLAPIKRVNAKRDLAILYLHGLATGGNVNEQFFNAAKRYRARFELHERAPVIYTSDGQEIEFHFTQEEMEVYARAHAQEMQQRESVQLLRELTAESDVKIITNIVEAKLSGEIKNVEEFEAELEDQGYRLVASPIPTLYLPNAIPTLYLPGGDPVPLHLQPWALSKYLLLHFGRDQLRLIRAFKEQVGAVDPLEQ